MPSTRNGEPISASDNIEENVRIARQAIEAFNTGDVSKVHELIGSEYFNHESQADPIRAKLRGPDEFIDTVKSLRNAFADLHYEEQEIIASNDNRKVVSVLTVTGEHVENFLVLLQHNEAFLIK